MGDCHPLPDCPHEGKESPDGACGESCECEARRKASRSMDSGEKFFQGALWLGIGILILVVALAMASLGR